MHFWIRIFCETNRRAVLDFINQELIGCVKLVSSLTVALDCDIWKAALKQCVLWKHYTNELEYNQTELEIDELLL